jgi:hypothetical protein
MIDVHKIKDKVLARDYKLTKEELDEVSIVYSEVTKIAGKQRVLDKSCNSCLNMAYTIIGNYIKFHLNEEPKPKAVIEVVEVGVMGELTYKQLIDKAKKLELKVPNNVSKKDLIKLIDASNKNI